MAKKKYVQPSMDDTVVEGIGPDVDFDSLPSVNVSDVVKQAAKQRVADPALLRAGVKDPYLPLEPLNKETTRSDGDPDYKREDKTELGPFKRDAPAQQVLKSMSHSGTVREKR